ncbi:MAG: cysteine desulfurase [Candidatus Woesearchaeota archaeon]|nr:MAG: cysteine desulfurase [Candidatus Woesearchaeota archaeon]
MKINYVQKNQKQKNYERNIMREDFPILKKDLVYLDNSATTQKPKIVIDTLKNYYENSNSNPHRGVYSLSEKTSLMVENARKKFARLINSDYQNMIFTKNATESINAIATSIERTFIFDKDDNIVVTEIEHHSNFLPWQQLCIRKNIALRIVPYDLKKQKIDEIYKYVDKKTKVVSFTAMSNVSGLIIDVKKAISQIRKKNKNTVIIIDATQYIAHKNCDVKEWDADFIVFSAHKIYGTTGVGLLYSKTKFLKVLEPFLYGGNMISYVSLKRSEWAEIPEKFEGGTMDNAGIIASAEALIYLNKTNHNIEEKIKDYALKRLKSINGLKIIGHNTKEYGPIISFIIKGIHPHDLASICDRNNICIRSGHHCAQPFMNKLGVPATSRISISFYNTTKDIDKLIDSINQAKKILN